MNGHDQAGRAGSNIKCDALLCTVQGAEDPWLDKGISPPSIKTLSEKSRKNGTSREGYFVRDSPRAKIPTYLV